MGTFHRRVLSDLGFDVTTVDPVPGRADYLSIPRGRFDVVCVAVPIDHLADEAARWAGYGGRLLIEKPMAATSRDAIELVALLDGQCVAVGYVERFNPQVRRLARELTDSPPPTQARFVRWSDRRSPDVALDLRSHDVDLATHLNLRCPVEFSCATERAIKQRVVTVQCGTRTLRADLLAHSASPLHTQWHSFLHDRADCATPDDATDTLLALELAAAVAA